MNTKTPDILIGFDTETHLIGPYKVAPPLVCATAWDGEQGSLEAVANRPALDALLDSLFDEDIHVVAHNAAFDLAVISNARPDLVSAIFEALAVGRVFDTKIREKLLNLSTTGKITHMELPGGAKQQIDYSLAGLVMKYLNEDRSASKATIKDGKVIGENDAWRLNYQALEGMPVETWPEDARAYAIQDSEDAYLVWWAQEQRRREIIEERGIDPFATQALQVSVDFCLYLMGAWGMATDAATVHELEREMEKELSGDKLNLLIDAGILRPAEEPKPYANGAKDKDGNLKMTKGTAESINQTKLKAYVEKLCKSNHEAELRRTAPSDKFPEGQVCVDAEWLNDFAHLDPMLEQYQHRQSLQKIVKTEIPRMKDVDGNVSPIVWPSYDVLKETTRTSSFGSSLYPSFNIQNVMAQVRKCFVPREGNLLFSNDYGALELCSAAQKCLTLFGHSKLAELINADMDPHEYLGAQIAYHMHEDFRASCDEGKASSSEDIYKAFHECKNHDIEAVADFWKHFRTMAKPTGLGYPGGLGPKTLIKYAKHPYGVVVDLETATSLRDLWRATFPEMVEYHKWINEQIDPWNQSRTRLVDGEERSSPVYTYISPLGQCRAGADYCAAANGAALQTPSAEGAKLAVFSVVRSCYDPALSSLLLPDGKGPTVRPIGFIHDEIVGEVRDDEKTSDRVTEVARLMREAMKVICPDINVKVGMALMRRWDKSAEAVFDDSGRLIPWEPKLKDHSNVQQETTERNIAA